MNGWPGRSLVILALVAAIGGTAFAANELTGAATTKKTVRACVTKKTGAVRVLLKKRARCRKSRGEVALAWSRRGPRGVQGTAGAPGTDGTNGTNGAQGEPGPSNAYIKTDTFAGRSIGTSYTRLLTLRNLPAGSYLVRGNASLSPFAAGSGAPVTTRVACRLLRLAGEQEVDYKQADFFIPRGFALDEPPIPLEGPMTLAEPGTVALECRSIDGTALDSGFSSTLSATRVGTLDVQPHSAVDP